MILQFLGLFVFAFMTSFSFIMAGINIEDQTLFLVYSVGGLISLVLVTVIASVPERSRW